MKRVVILGLIFVACDVASAEDFAIRSVRFIVANSPGGTTDLIARLLAKQLSEKWGQSVVVDNRPGGSGTIGTDLVAKATPNGYTILISAPAPITTNITLFGKLPYDPIKDLTPITLVALTPSLLLVGPSVPAKSVTELIDLAKSKPGKLNYASAGTGNPGHLQGAMLSNIIGVGMVHIPYKGTGPALTDLLGGQVDMMFTTIPAVLPFVKANRLRALAITSQKRFESLPDVPTMTELGYPRIASTGWYGVLAPAKLPAPMIKRLHADFVNVIASPHIKEVLVGQGAEVIANTPEQFSEFIRRQTENIRKLISLSGAKAD